MNKELRKNYENAVNAYIKEFEFANEIDFDSWVGDEIGGVCSFGDYSFAFSDIKHVVDNKVAFDWLISWYWFVVEYEKCYICLDSYCRKRRDAERNPYFNIHDFEKKLLHEKIKKSEVS